MRRILFLLLIINSLHSCSVSKIKKIRKETQQAFMKPFYDNQFLGVFIYDPINNDTLVKYNSEKYFTPASTTKIATLYTALNVLPKNIPTLKYHTTGDTIYIEGTGDPSLLHPYFKDSTALHFLKGYNHIKLNLNNFKTTAYGPGWAWEDYDAYYQPERSSFPMYGNVLSVYKNDSITITPSIFKNNILAMVAPKARDQHRNIFYNDLNKKDTTVTPFIVDDTLVKSLLDSALNKNVELITKFPEVNKQTVYSIPTDSILKRMMAVSDNFLAEQLLISSSATLSDTLSFRKAQRYILEHHLADLKQPPRWVDGSGLSRYNLFTPESLVHILKKIYMEQSQERIFDLFPAGGVSGTLTNWYGGINEPYLYAKSGSLGNVYCLSGYLRTKSDKTLIFSIMNNHYKQPTEEIKKRMQLVFENLRDHY
ncbi:D-alanyl-D-alanine carboxypeptidase/D-alanyl-D-alanine-endopeptidase [Cellulophaga sp. E6(2014)]|uniref:D-alanyl-D-alanine carboxypeptidase/D-alanyl-D-alanine-endopeptidase n=1 Tax=Cellulophaga sp. E6(2014) TaxID=1495334 RepID=UPI00051DC928|nr:D-alanyl-D-alanine carboxypeptidase [Cellulophaga sp. E6(2014)]KGK30643.1 D-alanyl-D-alanine carboxypeptidase [Cellulophaga sp. E6(2014)]